MDSFEPFRQALRDALGHLHDPDYRPPELLYAVMSCAPENGAGPVQSDIIRVIKGLKPPPNVPRGARERRDYDLLYHRFVLKLTQEETAERLHMSVRSVRRAQREASHVLARLLWEHSLARETSQEDWAQGTGRSDEGELLVPLPDWRAQVQQDMASLQISAPGAIADVEETIRRAVEVESVLVSRYDVRLQIGSIRSGLLAAIHPSALRQILIMAIGQLARCASPGQIEIHARRRGEAVEIDLTSASPAVQEPPAAETLADDNLIQEILASQGGALHVERGAGQVSMLIQVPAAGQLTVLVVDDNLDQVHFYRRSTAGTRYRIVHAPQGERTVQAIQEVAPDVIVLDILLPDVDGWDLLADLRANPATRSIPTIICSIIKEEELATALGAAMYLPKPVHHRAFIQALAAVLDRRPTTGTKN
jgi:CheY-like chemotaxis protein